MPVRVLRQAQTTRRRFASVIKLLVLLCLLVVTAWAEQSPSGLGTTPPGSKPYQIAIQIRGKVYRVELSLTVIGLVVILLLTVMLSIAVVLALLAWRNARRLRVANRQLQAEITERERATEQIRISELRFRQLADSMPQIVWTAEHDGSIAYFNRRWHEFTGREPSANLTEEFYSAIHPDDLQGFLQGWKSAVDGDEPHEAECRLTGRSIGGARWFLCRSVPVHGISKDASRFGTLTDIDHQKLTERSLQRANDELRQFAYAAAHDMQEPLRNIILSLSLLQRDYQQRFDKTGNDWVGQSIENGRRMHTMIKDLLSYSKILDTDGAAAVTDANQSLRNALANLEAAIHESQAELICDALPQLKIQETHLVQLFQNLIGNSIKFRRPKITPVIRVSALRAADEWQLSVADNGIGFDPAYATRIFGVFKRLNHRSEYPGTGIGLALCARIVAHYGGRIWAQAEPGKGATLHFTLPS